MKALFITEKQSVAREFAAALNINAKNRDGYMEGDKAVITWCVGHLVTMSYPDQYDPADHFFFCLGVDPDTFFLLVFADIGLLVYQTVDVFSLSSGVSADVDRINVFSIKQ